MDATKKLTDKEFEELTACKNEQEWNAACDRVKAARHGQYPFDWWPRMMVSGVMRRVFDKWEKR